MASRCAALTVVVMVRRYGRVVSNSPGGSLPELQRRGGGGSSQGRSVDSDGSGRRLPRVRIRVIVERQGQGRWARVIKGRSVSSDGSGIRLPRVRAKQGSGFRDCGLESMRAEERRQRRQRQAAAQGAKTGLRLSAGVRDGGSGLRRATAW